MLGAMADGNRPRYREIAEHLRVLVAEREPGDLLPSEAELCEQFGVSRMTARHGIQLLEREHLLHRKRGRGTFVSHRPIPRLLGSPLSFSESMRRRGMRPSSRVLESGYAAPDAEDRQALRIADTDQVGVLERIRYADGTPMAIERAVLAPGCAAVLETVGAGSLHDAFGAAGWNPSSATARVDARLATDRERALLQLDPGGVVLCERRVIYDQNGSPLEHTETRYAADRYVFDVMMYRDEPGATGGR